MTAYRQLIAGAVTAAEVVSATSFTWYGVPSRGLPPEAAAEIGGEDARALLVDNLQMQLYTDFYCAGAARPQLDDAPITAMPGVSPFAQALSAANQGTAGREPGWTVLRQEGDDVVVTRGGLSLWVAAADLYTPDGTAARPGMPAGLLMPNELLRLSPGFYMALGNAEFPGDGSAPIVRLYWNIRSEGAPALVELLTARLNAEQAGFRFKIVNDPAGYRRCDAGVLYTLKDQYDQVIPVVAAVYGLMRDALKPSVPALTRCLAPGLGLAEDPGDPLTSFGMSRCRLLAEAIVQAADATAPGPYTKQKCAEEQFASAGIDLDRPYLNAGSADGYWFPAE
jgi:hypothetical protein